MSTELPQLRPADAIQAIGIAIDKDNPIFLQGPPGVGKTSLMEQVARERDLPCLTVSLTLMDPVDLRGLPVINPESQTVRWLPLGELPTEGKGIINFDEINTADPSVMAAAMRLILERKLGEYTMPPGYRITATGNRVSDGASANKMPTALADRFTQVELVVNADDWAVWAEQNGVPLPLIAFLQFRKDLLHVFDSSHIINTSPRGWADFGEYIEDDPDLASHVNFALASGRVGTGPATEYRAFGRIWRDLPPIEGVMDGSFTDITNIDTPGKRFAMTSALAYSMEPAGLKNAVTYVKRLGAEFCNMLVMTSIRTNPSVASSPEYFEMVQSGVLKP